MHINMNVKNDITEPARDEVLLYTPKKRMTKAFAWLGADMFLEASARQRKSDKIFLKYIGRNTAIKRLRRWKSRVMSLVVDKVFSEEHATTTDALLSEKMISIVHYAELNPREQLVVRKLVSRAVREKYTPRVPDEALGDLVNVTNA